MLRISRTFCTCFTFAFCFFVNITQNARFVACSMEIPSKILSNFPPFLQLHPGHRSHGSSAVAESHPRSCWGHFLSRHHGFQKADPMTWMKTGTHLIRKLPGSTSWLVHVPKKNKRYKEIKKSQCWSWLLHVASIARLIYVCHEQKDRTQVDALIRWIYAPWELRIWRYPTYSNHMLTITHRFFKNGWSSKIIQNCNSVH